MDGIGSLPPFLLIGNGWKKNGDRLKIIVSLISVYGWYRRLDDVRWCSMAKPAGRNQLHLSSGENQLRESGDLTSKLGVCWVYPANWTWLAGSYQPFKVHWFFHLFWIIWLGFSICCIARGRSPPLQAPNVKTPANPNPNRGFSPVSACQCDRLEPRNAAATPVATPGTTTSFALSTLNSGCWRGNGGDNSSLSLSLAHAWGHNDTLATIALIHGCEGRIFRARENEKVGEPQGKCGKFKLMQIAQWCHVLSQFGRKCLMQCTCTSVALQPPVWANVRATRKTINVFQLSMGWFKKTSKPRIPCFFTRKYGGFQSSCKCSHHRRSLGLAGKPIDDNIWNQQAVFGQYYLTQRLLFVRDSSLLLWPPRRLWNDQLAMEFSTSDASNWRTSPLKACRLQAGNTMERATECWMFFAPINQKWTSWGHHRFGNWCRFSVYYSC